MVVLVVAYVVLGGLIGAVATLVVPALAFVIGWNARSLTLPSAAKRELHR